MLSASFLVGNGGIAAVLWVEFPRRHKVIRVEFFRRALAQSQYSRFAGRRPPIVSRENSDGAYLSGRVSDKLKRFRFVGAQD